MAKIWIEAESFSELGGWVIDQQSMEQMGSAYIMAHGMGVPVADAKTTCCITESGAWTVWVRTRDWTAVWKRGKPAGIFQAHINGTALPETLGTNGEAWGWQKAGTVTLHKGDAAIALHVLSGFNGRCDAIYLTTDPDELPENDTERLAEFRRTVTNTVCTDDPVEYDLVVAGGGMAGICTALAAIRTGSKVVLIQDRPVLGGCNSSEIRVGLGGFAHTEYYPNLGNIVTEISPVMGGPGTYPDARYYEDERKENVFSLHSGSGAKLALNERVIAVEKDTNDPRRIRALITRNIRTGAETRYRARNFADCTGDAIVARMMDAKLMYGRESQADFNESLAPEKGDNQVMGMSVLWGSRKTAQPSSFPDIDWGIPFNEENAYYIRGADWEWETGQYRNQADETEYIRDYGMMAIYANWSYLKNHSRRKAEWSHDTLSWVSPVGGKRESYRVVGDYVLNQNDIENRVIHPDATAAMTWSIDLHFPDPENAAKFKEPFRSCAYHRGIGKPYPVPYRCLYAKDVTNLFLGGRIISASHVAFSCVRVMRTLGILGEVIGMAASICAQEHADPRDIYGKHFDKLKAMMEKGVPSPVYHAYDCDDSESYHFKELGFIHINTPDAAAKKFGDPALAQRIKALNVRHKNGAS
ncbi:MAG: FAD-dependent oxidoreductase [Spirochaetes bacterium]|nr:FAD-dependent oxidoreductase [Spirochaetota bacterium]